MPRSLVALLVLGLLAGCGRDDGAPPRFRVRVLDQDGKPVAGAEVQARYAPGWRRVGSDGTARLADVPLRAGEDVTPAAVAAAIDVRSEFYALRGDPLAVRDEGGWEVTLRTQRHGVLRLHVPLTRFTNVEAWVEPQPGFVEPIEGIEVARPAQPASWRVFPGAKDLTLHLRGDAPIAWEAQVVPPPSPGFLREETFHPRSSVAIVGRVVPPDPAPPTLAGQVHVTELHGDGSRVRRESVIVADDGGFAVPYVGPGTFELVAACRFLRDSPPLVVKAGEFAEIPGAGRPWLEVETPDLEEEQRAAAIVLFVPPLQGLGRFDALDGFRLAGRTWIVREVEGWTSGTVSVLVDGTDRLSPREGRAEVEFPASGGGRVSVATPVAAHGTVSVRAPPEASGAKVKLRRREKSALPALGDTQFPNVAVGEHVVRVTYPHSKGTVDLPVTVRPDETTVLEIPAR